MTTDPKQSSDNGWPYAQETPEQRNARMAWWREARYGMFIHWGVYTVPAGTYHGEKIKNGGEWILYNAKIPLDEYTSYSKDFNPVKYDPKAWVKLAQDAGMKYIIITAKHHDGFALWDTDASDWNIVKATPYGKDLLEPLAKACQEAGMKLGFYYSQAQDWYHPGGARWLGIDAWDPAQEGDMTEYMRNIVAPQVKELLTQYGEISVLWWDTPTDMTQEHTNMIQPLMNLQPGIVTNDRVGNNCSGDFITPEQHVPAKGFDHDWEACMTMNRSWGYKSYDDEWKDGETLLINLIDIVSKGGNYLLNVGPDELGQIPAPCVERLKFVGQWLKTNGQAIYGTTATPFSRLSWGRCTKVEYINGAKLYLHVFNWPQNGKLLVPGLRNKVAQAYLMADMKQGLETRVCDNGIIIHVPDQPLDDLATVIVLKVNGKLVIDEVSPGQDENGIVNLTAQDADIHNVLGGEFDPLHTIKEKVIVGSIKDPLCDWADPRVAVDWTFEITKPGKFQVVADMSIKGDKTAFTLQVGEQSQAVIVAASKELRLGDPLRLDTGKHTLKINPVDESWSAVNLRSVSLHPVSEG